MCLYFLPSSRFCSVVTENSDAFMRSLGFACQRKAEKRLHMKDRDYKRRKKRDMKLKTQKEKMPFQERQILSEKIRQGKQS